MLNVKAADDPKSDVLALWPRLQSIAVEPVTRLNQSRRAAQIF
jgi:hypothetical protein